MSETEPSAAAMRAAEAIWKEHDTITQSRLTRIAAIIDDATGLPRLLAAFEQIITVSENPDPDGGYRIDGTYDSGSHSAWLGAADIARAALKPKDET